MKILIILKDIYHHYIQISDHRMQQLQNIYKMNLFELGTAYLSLDANRCMLINRKRRKYLINHKMFIFVKGKTFLKLNLSN